MHQVLLRIPIPGTDHGITLYGYGMAMCLGFLAAILWAARRAKRDGQPPEIIYNIALFCFFGGVFGGRAFYCIQNSGRFPSLWDLVKIWEGGLTFYGGVILATLAVVVYLKVTRRSVLYWLDVIAPSLAMLIRLAVSRQREYLADAGAVELTRYPQGLIGALEKPEKPPAGLAA